MGGKFNVGGKLSRVDGFTVLEILVAMAIFTILGAFAVPQWGNLLSKYRLDSAARLVATELHGARNRAMAQYRRFTRQTTALLAVQKTYL
jgi:prepilin-type N-terminal cleavage/methylation domain-containing protein